MSYYHKYVFLSYTFNNNNMNIFPPDYAFVELLAACFSVIGWAVESSDVIGWEGLKPPYPLICFNLLPALLHFALITLDVLNNTSVILGGVVPDNGVHVKMLKSDGKEY